jgi:hypothetical protein
MRWYSWLATTSRPAHLYQIFPKLGIMSRAALRDALADYSNQTNPTVLNISTGHSDACYPQANQHRQAKSARAAVPPSHTSRPYR